MRFRKRGAVGAQIIHIRRFVTVTQRHTDHDFLVVWYV
jgi:hypothetical protein